jgi:hypothetical protein
MPKKYSSRKELKRLAMKFAEKNKMDKESSGRFLLEVDRLKSLGNMSDVEILMTASRNFSRDKQLFNIWDSTLSNSDNVE